SGTTEVTLYFCPGRSGSGTASAPLPGSTTTGSPSTRRGRSGAGTHTPGSSPTVTCCSTTSSSSGRPSGSGTRLPVGTNSAEDDHVTPSNRSRTASRWTSWRPDRTVNSTWPGASSQPPTRSSGLTPSRCCGGGACTCSRGSTGGAFTGSTGPAASASAPRTAAAGTPAGGGRHATPSPGPSARSRTSTAVSTTAAAASGRLEPGPSTPSGSATAHAPRDGRHGTARSDVRSASSADANAASHTTTVSTNEIHSGQLPLLRGPDSNAHSTVGATAATATTGTTGPNPKTRWKAS